MLEQLLEFLIPAIIIGFGLLGKFLESRSERKQDDPDEAAMAERRRQVQEELRRKIEQRRAQQTSETARQDDYDPSLPDHLQPPRRRTEPLLPAETRHQSKRRIEPAYQEPEPVFEQAEYPPIFEPDTPDRFQQLTDQLKAQKQAVAAARRRADSAKRQRLEQATAGSPALKGKVSAVKGGLPRTGILQDDVKAYLQDPHMARRAILLQEIIGTPVGLREDGAMRPSWR
jgi:hypothetical protein